jgi:hypothetical protein
VEATVRQRVVFQSPRVRRFRFTQLGVLARLLTPTCTGGASRARYVAHGKPPLAAGSHGGHPFGSAQGLARCAERLLGDAKSSRWVTLRARWVTLRTLAG